MDAIASDVFEKILDIAAGRAVAEEDSIFESLSGRKTRQPFQMAGGQLGVGGAVGWSHFGSRAVKELAVVVSADMEVAFVHQQVGCGGGLQRSGQVVAEIDDDVGRATGEVRAHRFEGTDVAVDIGDYGDPHVALLIEPDDMITDRLNQHS
jgi:hypothetical protein